MGYDCRIPYRYGTFGYQCNDQYGKRRNDRSFLGKYNLQTNWFVFEVWLLVFLIVFMFIVSCFTPKPTAKQIEAITFTTDYKKSIRESWNKWDVIATLGVVVLCGLFYAYFW